MGIKYTNMQSFFKKKELDISKLGFFNTKNTIKVSYWQPSGNIRYTRNEGFKCIEEEHKDKARQFIRSIKRDKAEIAITPEYSLPVSILEDILDDKTKELHPAWGKLWCFGIEAISSAEMKRICSKYNEEEHDDIQFIVENLDILNDNYFYSCVAYIFLGAKKVICVLQLKTTPAADKDMTLESNALTLGVRRHIVGGTNRTLISVKTTSRLCRIGACRRLSAE